MSIKKVLVINCGSSSVKFSLFNDQDQEVASGLAERLGTDDACLTVKAAGEKNALEVSSGDHEGAIKAILAYLEKTQNIRDGLVGVGHRVVHGGEFFAESVVVNEDSMTKIKQCSHLAPLHNPANVQGIEILQQVFPDLPQVAVFDTAFHQTITQHAFMYALPYQYYEKYGLRRYGFHGTSHKYVAHKAIENLGLAYDNNAIVTAHLGNGCSATAVLNGKSVDTSMGLTPLEGLMMGTRSGDLDPSIHQFLAEQLDTDLQGVTNILNKQSGLLGVSGLSNDMRTLCEAAEAGHQQAQLAIDMFCYRLAKTIGALAVPLGRLDALVFTGGIGENAAVIREKTLAQLALLGFEIDTELNKAHGKGSNGRISCHESPVALVIATQEEWMIAQDTFNNV